MSAIRFAKRGCWLGFPFGLRLAEMAGILGFLPPCAFIFAVPKVFRQITGFL
jgi:hypothetical protein